MRDITEFLVMVGSCVDGRRSFRATAHAHTRGRYRGWICVRSHRALLDAQCMIHEAAHIRTGQGHTDVWRREVLTLGGTLSESEYHADYHKRRARPGRYRGLHHPHHPECPCLCA